MATARDLEDEMLMRCVVGAHSPVVVANDLREANVFRVASMVIETRFPTESARLLKVCDDYFLLHPDDRLPSVDVVRNGWIFSLPRLRDMLSLKLHQG